MDRELIDHVWKHCLPKEFKEEVKKLYSKFYNEKPHSDCSYGYIGLLIKLFSIDNLTSDAEGEEMLTVPRKDIVELYQEVQKTISQCKGTELAIQAIGTKNVLWSFFGSKCLSDEEQPKQKDCDNPLADKEGCRWRNDGKCASGSAYYFEPLNPQEPKPAERCPATCQDQTCKNYDTDNCHCCCIEHCCYEPAKFKVGDMVKYRLDGKRYEVMGKTGKHHYSLNGYDKDVLESDLEPYTEPKENKHFDNIIKDGFSKERRLNIAAMAMQGILAHGELVDTDEVTDMALIYADELIEKCEEGGSK